MQKKIKISTLDVINLPLSGKILIEASAGTGKTSSLIILYLRLILGITHTHKNFLVKEVLVVTFTKHSKEELKTRIIKYIRDFRKICEKKLENNITIFQNLLDKIKNLKKAIFILIQAEQSIDELAIYTIHEFCYKSLQINKFCSEIFTQNKIIKNSYFLYLKSSNLFWNKYFSKVPKDVAKIILKYFQNPNNLLKNILPFLSNYNIKNKIFLKKNTVQLYEILIQKIKNFKKKWIENYIKMLISIEKSNINKYSYNKSNLLRWTSIITKWTKENTTNFNIPKQLKYFQSNYLIKKTLSGNSPKHDMFKITENFLKIDFSLKTSFIIESTLQIKQEIEKEKKNQGIFEFDDLITFLHKVLNKKNEKISKIIKKSYPVLLIDEFQDTNYQQYEIFRNIYKLKKDLFILIGDPKQAIYSFRGANISSYIQAKKNIKQIYELSVNWRSSKEMIDSTNFLFSEAKNPFLLSAIKFDPVKSIYKKKEIIFKIKKKSQPAIRFLYNKKLKITKDSYKNWIINSFVSYILFWLNEGEKKNAIIIHNKKTRCVSLNDICILVNNKKEACMMQQALHKVNIPSKYFSERKSVFHSDDALELFWIFQAILNPKNEFILKRAISTKIINKNFQEIDSLTRNYLFWSSLINIFYNYLSLWKKFGITCVIHQIIINCKISINNNLFAENIPNIHNILHIGELLEIKYNEIKNKHVLILWFEKKIAEQHDIPHEDYIRFEHSKNYIKIVTIHKSKGLEYPIVLIPFLILSYKNVNFDFKIFKENKLHSIPEKNILSENMRLLYVALTRAIVHCCIGIASIHNKKEKDNKGFYSSAHSNALEYIIQSHKKRSKQPLLKILLDINHNENIEITSELPQYYSSNTKNKIQYKRLKSKRLTRTLKYNYDITSYSKLKKMYNIKIPLQKNYNSFFENIHKKQKNKKSTKIITSYEFPKGKIFGTFIHNILKKINFQKNINIIWISNELKKNNFKETWSQPFKNWINSILNIPLNKNNLTLSQLNLKNCIKELKFFLSIKTSLTKKKIQNLIKLANISSNIPNEISLNPINGIITGSIDLVFKWNKKYYLLDYKSTHLGFLNSDYTKEKIENSITKNLYHLQYQLYSIALHKYLQQRMKNYSFHKHFGGMYILFLRAIDNTNSKNGIFFTLPRLSVIKKLNKMF
ncbi:MAG: exodeoxyribonuclease V subunit beta [Buchnera aphidicola (Nurudea shiraii)]